MKKESIKKPLLLIGLYLVLEVILVLIFNPLIKDTIESQTLYTLIINLIITVIMAFMLRDKLKGDFTTFKKNFWKNLKIMFKFWIIGLFLQMGTNLIINGLIIKDVSTNEAANREMLKGFTPIAILSMCIVGPILEELLFRLSFKNAIRDRKKFILVTGIIFGAMHLVASIQGNPLEMLCIIPYSILGMAFAAIFYDTKSITSSILMHAFHNSFTVALLLLTGLGG